MITQGLINSTVAGWNIIYASNKSEAELEFFARKLKQHLDRTYSDRGFQIAALLVERESRFFPTIADLVAVESAVQAKLRLEKEEQAKALPAPREEITNEQAALNLKKIEIIVGQISGKYTEQQALAHITRLNQEQP
jgi:hypothetical protein